MTRQKYYEHLCEIGVPDLIAASMANQATDFARKNKSKIIRTHIYGFRLWQETKESPDFWIGCAMESYEIQAL